MKDFARALFVAFSSIILVLGLVFAFELVNKTVSKSGFSSGEVFVIETENETINGEVLGKKFSFDVSFANEFFSFAEKLTLILPPPFQLFLRGIFFVLSL